MCPLRVGRWLVVDVAVLPDASRACGWGLPVWLRVCAGCPALTPVGGCGWCPTAVGWGVVIGWWWGSAAAHANDGFSLRATVLGRWLLESAGGI